MREIINKLLIKKQNKKACPLDKKQQNEIDRMKALGVDTTPYEKNTIKSGILREIRLCFEHGVDPNQIYRKGYKLRQWQCTQVRLAMEAKLPDNILNEINNKDLYPIDMTAKRLWYSDVPKEMQEYAEQGFSNKKNKIMCCNVLRRSLMIPIVQKSEKIREALFKNFVVRNDFSEYCFSNDEIAILKMVLILNIKDIENKEDECIKLLNEFDKAYEDADKQFYECKTLIKALDKELSSQESADLKYDFINQFFIDNINIELKKALEKLDTVKNKNEYNIEGNVFNAFDTKFFNKEHLTMYDTCGFN